MKTLSLTTPDGARFTKTGLILAVGLEWERWLSLGRDLGQMRRSLNYWQAQHLGYGRKEYGPERVEEAMVQLGFEFEDVKAAETLLKLEVAPREELGVEHHFVLARAELPAEEEERWLDVAVKEKLSARDLQKSIRAGCVVRSEGAEERRQAGVPTPNAVRHQFDLWLKEVDEVSKEWPVEVIEKVLEQLDAVVEFGLRMRARRMVLREGGAV